MWGCVNAEHRVGVLFVGDELTAEDQAKIDSVNNGLTCRSKQLVFFSANVPLDDD